MISLSPWNECINLFKLDFPFKGTVSRDFPAQTAYIIHLQIASLFMDKKDFASFCKLAKIFAYLSHLSLSRTALSASWALSRTVLSKTGRYPGQLRVTLAAVQDSTEWQKKQSYLLMSSVLFPWDIEFIWMGLSVFGPEVVLRFSTPFPALN